MANIMVISTHDPDFELGRQMAERLGHEFHPVKSLLEVHGLLSGTPDWFVIYDGGDRGLSRSMLQMLPKYVSPSTIFAITDLGLEESPQLLTYPVYGHHLRRVYTPAAMSLYSKIFKNCLYLKPNGLAPFFDGAAIEDGGAPPMKIRAVELKRSSHKTAAVEAIQNTLTSQGVPLRLAKAVAQATDELVMNAVFDAPIDAGRRYRHLEPRDADFTLNERERVHLEFAVGPSYAGILVADQFGSFERSRLFASVRSHLQRKYPATAASGAQGAGFGLQGVIRSGLSLVMLCQPAVRTEAMLFFPLAKDFREFRSSFRIFSVLTAS